MGEWHPTRLTYQDIPGCAALIGHFFTRNPWTWVPFSTKISLRKMMWRRQHFGCSHGEHPKIVKNGPVFWDKFFQIYTILCKNDPQIGYGFRGKNGTPRTNLIQVPQNNVIWSFFSLSFFIFYSASMVGKNVEIGKLLQFNSIQFILFHLITFTISHLH